MQLSWCKDTAGEWCALDGTDSPAVGDYGVFVIWRNGDSAQASAVLYVGRGHLSYEIAKCRRDPLFHGNSELRITWATVDDSRTIDAVAAYLYQHLRPIWGEAVFAPPLPVNLPLTA